MSALAVLCSGQGSQHPALLEPFYQQAAAQPVLAALAALMGEPVQGWLARVPAESLFRNSIAQPLICARALAAWRVLAPRLPAPRLFAGYSVGELAAYGCAGALGIEETLELAQSRARLMDAAASGSGLLALKGLPRAPVAALCEKWGCHIAIFNGRDHFVVGGVEDRLDALAGEAKARGARFARRLDVALASHTPLLEGAVAAFRAHLAASSLALPATPVLAGVHGAPVRERAEAVEALAAQLARPIDWAACMGTALEAGCRVFLELGPGTGLARMVLEDHPDTAARSLEEFRSIDRAAEWVERELERAA